jgi:hypothetical protein
MFAAVLGVSIWSTDVRVDSASAAERALHPWHLIDGRHWQIVSSASEEPGNVDEWTTSVVPGERPSILKGGYWGPVRTRCRPSTRAHGETFAFYQQGFRCCRDAPPSTADDPPRDD